MATHTFSFQTFCRRSCGRFRRRATTLSDPPSSRGIEALGGPTDVQYASRIDGDAYDYTGVRDALAVSDPSRVTIHIGVSNMIQPSIALWYPELAIPWR